MVLLTLLLVSALSISPPVELELESLNGTYTDLRWPVEPIQRGSFSVSLSSPRHRLEVLSHHLTLRRRDGNTCFVAAEVEIEGTGDLRAVVSSPAGESVFKDHLVVPRQRLAAEGIVQLVRIPGTNGDNYQLTLLDRASRTVELRVETDIAAGVLSICNVLDSLPIPLFSCSGLDSALRTFEVPIPAIGSLFVIDRQHLDPRQIDQLDRLLADEDSP